MPATVTAVSPEIGVEVCGLSGHELVDRSIADQCEDLLEKHGVVIYREVHIDDDDLVAFSRMLGEVVVPRFGGEKDHPEVSKVTIDPAESKLAAYTEGAFLWHIDGANDDVPQKGTLLTAKVVSEEGGDTEFANTYAAYEALPDDEKERLGQLRAVHSVAATQRLVHPNPTDKQLAEWARVPSKEHPLVWTRKNGRKSLLVGATMDRIVDLSDDDSRALINRLNVWATDLRFVLRHHWRPGDLVTWDNTGMLHRAMPYTIESHRLMHRTTLVGEEAVA